MHRANLIAHILGKTKDTKRCFTIKNQRLTKDIRKPFYFNYITSQTRLTALFTKILRDVFLPCKKNVKATQLALNKFTLFLLHQNLTT